MYVSTVRLYHPALWKMFFTYRVVLVLLRAVELQLKAITYVFFKAPLLILWTRIPGLRYRRPPLFANLAEVLAPVQERASISIGVGQMGSDFATAKSAAEMASIQGAIVGGTRPPSRFWSLVGCFMRGYFTDQGPVSIKFGQIMSMREEMPPVIKNELQLLQDKLPAMKFKEVRKILERELDRPLEEVFEYIEETPIAAASLSQVHRAKLRKEQEEVALKIQRPYLQGIVALDVVYLCDVVILGLVRRILPTLGKGADFAIFTTSFRDSLAQEIDFIHEERYQSKFRKICESHPIYSQANKIAKTYREYTTTKLLTMELVKNYHRLDRLLDELTPEQLLDFATTRVEGLPQELPLHLIWVQICIQLEGLSHWGLSHGDVHLGNMYALAPEKAGDPWRIFLCDFGMMIEQTERERMLGVEAGTALSYAWDGGMLAQAFANQGLKPITPQNMLGLRNAMGSLTDKHFTELRDGAEKRWLIRTQRGTSLSMVSEITYSASVFGLSISPFGWLLLKNFSYLVNMGLTMWTSYSPGNMWAPHCKKYVKDVVHHELETRNVTNMRESLPGILMNLRPHDRKQILTCLSNGGKVKPMEIVWVDDWDIRGLADTPETSDVGG